MMIIDKEKVASRFGKNVSTYNQEAFIQKKITSHLFDELMQYEAQFSNAFEIGCGSGFFTEKLIPHVKKDFIVNDLDPLCTHLLLKQNSELSFIGGDVEQVVLPQNRQLIASTSVLQWMQDIEKLLRRIYDALLPEGYFAFSTFGASNFREIKALLNEGLDYFSLEEWNNMLKNTGFKILKSWEWKEACFFQNGTSVLKHMKNTGVNGCSNNKKIWNTKILQQFNEEYSNHFTQKEGVSLTYHPLFFILKK